MPAEYQDEVVRASVVATKFTAEALLKLIEWIIQHRLQTQTERIVDSETIRTEYYPEVQQMQLIDRAALGKEINDVGDLLNRLGVDFSVSQDKDTGTYHVAFKGQDIDQIYNVLENGLQDVNAKKQPIKQRLQEAEKEAQKANTHITKKETQKHTERER